MQYLIFGTLLVLAAGLITSTSLLALSHILMAIPALYFIPKTKWKLLPMSFWALLGVILSMIFSVIVNWDIMVEGYGPILKVKYFVFGLLMVAPFSWFFRNHYSDKKIKVLLYIICSATIVAGVAGTITRYTHFNIITMKRLISDRNFGLSGMVLNYAHNLCSFEVILFGVLLFSKERLKNIISKKFLWVVFIVNLYFLYTTYTRGALVAFGAGIAAYAIKNAKLFFIILFSIVAVGLLAYINIESFYRPESDYERSSNWKTAIEAFKEKPILGYGYTNFEKHSLDIKIRHKIPPYKHGHAHNNLLEMLASTGIIGFFFFVSWIILWFIEMFKRGDMIGRIGTSYIATFMASGLTESSIGLGFLLFFIMASYALSVQKPEFVD